MKQEIRKILQITAHQYDILVFEHYWLWCQLNAINETHLQLLMASPGLSKWWNEAYAKHQQHFLEVAEPYKNLSKHYLMQLYKQETIKIREYYPKPLLTPFKIVKNYQCNQN